MTIRRRWNVWKVARCTLVLTGLFAISLATHSTAFAQSGTFSVTGSLNTARYNHTATLMQNGQVLVTGGLGVNGVYISLASAELYVPTGKK